MSWGCPRKPKIKEKGVMMNIIISEFLTKITKRRDMQSLQQFWLKKILKNWRILISQKKVPNLEQIQQKGLSKEHANSIQGPQINKIRSQAECKEPTCNSSPWEAEAGRAGCSRTSSDTWARLKKTEKGKELRGIEREEKREGKEERKDKYVAVTKKTSMHDKIKNTRG